MDLEVARKKNHHQQQPTMHSYISKEGNLCTMLRIYVQYLLRTKLIFKQKATYYQEILRLPAQQLCLIIVGCGARVESVDLFVNYTEIAPFSLILSFIGFKLVFFDLLLIQEH